MVIVLFALLLAGWSGCATASPKPEERNVEIVSVRGEESPDPTQMTRARLQTELMRFADHYVARLTQGFQELEESAPPPDLWRLAFEDMLFSVHAAYTIAADPEPSIGMLDMVVLVSLGRIVYEEDKVPTHGPTVEPMLRAFQALEPQAWTMAAKVLSSEQQEELRELIREWRKQNQDVQTFAFVRFGNFADVKSDSALAQAAASGGLFGTVREATRQIDEVRNLAERGFYLGTRMPLLSQGYVELVLLQALRKPQIATLMGNIDQLSGVAKQMPEFVTKERKATVDQVMRRVETLRRALIDQVMERVEVEREATVQQVFAEVSRERTALLNQLISEEQRVRGVLTDLRGTVTAANELATTVNTLMVRLVPEQPDGVAPQPSEPLDIKDVRGALADVTQIIQRTAGLVQTVDTVMASPHFEERLPRLVQTLGQESEQLIDHSTSQAILLVLTTLGGILAVLLIYLYVSRRVLRPSAR